MEEPKRSLEVAQAEIVGKIQSILDAVQVEMLEKATKKRNECIAKVTKWEEVMPALNQKKLVLAPWCEEIESEEEIKKLTKELSEQQVTVFIGNQNH